VLGCCLVSSALLVAVSAVDRFTRGWHKRYFCVCAAFGAFDFRHLSRGTGTSILITHFVFHRPNFLVIRKIILAAIIGMTLTALPSSTQVKSPVYHTRNRQDHHKSRLRNIRVCGVVKKKGVFSIIRFSKLNGVAEVLGPKLLGGVAVYVVRTLLDLLLQ